MEGRTRIGPVVSAAELAELLRQRPDVRLLDVRTPAEHQAAHIPGAYNVPLDTLGEHAAEIRAAVAAPVVLVCQSGARARRAETALQGCSMANVHVLEDGMNGWLAAGQPVNRGRARLSLERQVRIVAGSVAAAGSLLALLVAPVWAVVPALVGSGLVFAGVTDRCGLAFALTRLPWNRGATCDVEAMVAALKAGAPPAAATRELSLPAAKCA
jgi:rhodanese-related sulfurtransferase